MGGNGYLIESIVDGFISVDVPATVRSEVKTFRNPNVCEVVTV